MNAPKFSIGQEIVCVNDDFTLLLVQNPNIQTPERGPIYHVRGLLPVAGKGWGVLLQEIYNGSVAPGFPEANFHEDRFAPVTPPEEMELAIAELMEESVTV